MSHAAGRRAASLIEIETLILYCCRKPLMGNNYKNDSSQGPTITGAFLPLYEPGPGRPLITDEAYALSHTRILQ